MYFNLGIPLNKILNKLRLILFCVRLINMIANFSYIFAEKNNETRFDVSKQFFVDDATSRTFPKWRNCLQSSYGWLAKAHFWRQRIYK